MPDRSSTLWLHAMLSDTRNDTPCHGFYEVRNYQSHRYRSALADLDTHQRRLSRKTWRLVLRGPSFVDRRGCHKRACLQVRWPRLEAPRNFEQGQGFNARHGSEYQVRRLLSSSLRTSKHQGEVSGQVSGAANILERSYNDGPRLLHKRRQHRRRR